MAKDLADVRQVDFSVTSFVGRHWQQAGRIENENERDGFLVEMETDGARLARARPELRKDIEDAADLLRKRAAGYNNFRG